MATELPFRVRPGRRQFMIGAGALLVFGPMRGVALANTNEFPAVLAGIDFPSTALARSALALSRRVCPPWLFNHSMRTYFFGALWARHESRAFDPELAFTAAAFHDLGLLQPYESAEGSFEIDGANSASKLAAAAGAERSKADGIWHAVAMHDRWALASRESSEAALVAAGAGCDVAGVDADAVNPAALSAVLAVFPRLGFKAEFKTALTEHCKRKPLSQIGTWLDGFCRSVNPTVTYPSTGDFITNAPFDE